MRHCSDTRGSASTLFGAKPDPLLSKADPELGELLLPSDAAVAGGHRGGGCKS